MIGIFASKKDGNRGARKLSELTGGILNPEHPVDIAVRWGYRSTLPPHKREVNTPEAIYNAYNKALARKIMQEKGVPVPKTWFEKDFDEPFPYIARPAFHSLGKDFNVIEDRRALAYTPDGYYYQAIFPKREEFRAIVGGGKVLCAWRKHLNPDDIRANHRYALDKPREYVNLLYKDLAVLACHALGLEIGGVDIMVGETAVICEVNTMPILRDLRSAQAIADYIKQIKI